MQTCPGDGMLLEQLPGAQEIQPGAETGLADDQAAPGRQGRKALTQIVLFKKNVARFIKARQVGKIHVVEHPRAREPLVVPVELGVRHYRFHGRLGNGKAAILADRR